MPDTDDPIVPGRHCPVCGEPARRRTRPFCSKRCADVDLGRWLTGAYAIPCRSDEGEGDASVPSAPAGRDED